MATDRIRLTILVPEDLRAALRLEAAKRGEEMSDVATEILEAALTDALEEVRQRQAKKGKGGKS
jgi:plasmid stability protein